MWHCAVSVVFDLGGHRMRFGSVQLSPFDGISRIMDVSRVLCVFNSGDIPGLIAGDWNCVGSDPGYDPDPYPTGQDWHPDFVYQLDDDGTVYRRAAHRLESPRLGRMRDCARITGAPWTPTTGHHPTDNHRPGRIDRWYVTHHLPDAAITGYQVWPVDKVGDSTDHLPVLVDIDPRVLPG